MFQIQHTTAHDPFYDFCMWQYQPPKPFIAKFRSINLLLHSFDAKQLDERAYSTVAAIQEGIGPFRTVWGIKKKGNVLAWEFYFYDYQRRERRISFTRLKKILDPYVSCGIPINESINYFMFSLDLNENSFSGSSPLDEVHLYLGNPGSTVSSGICYSHTSQHTKLENFYFFFDTRKGYNDILSKVVCSAYFDSASMEINKILWPELKNCKVIVVANKQQNDSVYFSGINIEQLVFFLKKTAFPRDLISFIEDNKSRLDHLLYDVGFDYRMVGGDLIISKSAYYGIF